MTVSELPHGRPAGGSPEDPGPGPELRTAPGLAYCAVCNGENLNREQQ